MNLKIKKVLNPKIMIKSYVENDKAVLEISDNAGGIPDKILDKIFEANFTTKAESKGTGMGLHLVFLILQKIGGEINVKNIENGAKFIIKLKNK